MKFKEHNTQRLMSSRKNHELDPLRLYRSQTARPKSSKNNINKHWSTDVRLINFKAVHRWIQYSVSICQTIQLHCYITNLIAEI
jgi:hypothetical protein